MFFAKYILFTDKNELKLPNIWRKRQIVSCGRKIDSTSRHINIGAIETVSQYKLNYDFTFKVFDHENTVLTLKKCQYWQKFNVGEILYHDDTSNILGIIHVF